MHNINLEKLRDFIPKYWQDHLAAKIDVIHNRQIASGRDCASFGLISDMHLGVADPNEYTNQYHSPALMEKVVTSCDIPYFFNAGDIFAGYGTCTKDMNIADFVACKELFKNIENKCLVVEGNHDAVYSEFEEPEYYAQNMSFEEFYEYFFRNQAQYKDRHFGFDGTYYYVDMEFQKTRLIVLNTHDVPSDASDKDGRPYYNKFKKKSFGIRQKQLEWFCNVALDVPTDEWTVVLCTHESPAEIGRDGVCGFGLIHDVLNAFKRHTKFSGKSQYDEEQEHFNCSISVDYTNKGGNFAVWVSGHSHYDKSAVIDGILSVVIVNDSMHNAEQSSFKHIEGTTTEQALDIFTIDKSNHKIYVTRIGGGEDREFSYEVF